MGIELLKLHRVIDANTATEFFGTEENVFLATMALLQICPNGTLADLRGKRVLDIGCGSDEIDYKWFYPPVLPILAGINGADAVGIDVCGYSGPGQKMYTHYVADLTKTRLTDIPPVQQHRFDLVVCNGLIEDASPSPRLLNIVSNDLSAYNDFARSLLTQLEQLRDTGAKIWLNHNLW